MAIKFAAKDEVKSAPVRPIRDAEAKAASKSAVEGPVPSAAGTDLFDSEPKAPARKRKIK